MIDDILKLVDALKTQQWLLAFVLAAKIAGEIISQLPKGHAALAGPVQTGDIGTIIPDLEQCCQAPTLPSGKLLALLLALLKLLFPLI